MERVFYACLVMAFLATPARAAESPVESFFSGLFGRGAVAQPSRQAATHRHARLRSPGQPARHAASKGSFTAMASWYGGGESLSKHTATGERFRASGLTAAHRSLPLGTRLLVSHGGRSVVVRVNDRGPAAWTGRSLDVSRGAAAQLGLIQRGTGAVHVTVLARE